MCECIEQINKLLEPKNARLETAFTHGKGKIESHVFFNTEKIDKSKRGKSAPKIFPSYCAFCGEKLEEGK